MSTVFETQPLRRYEMWLWSSRNDFIAQLKGSHATWS